MDTNSILVKLIIEFGKKSARKQKGKKRAVPVIRNTDTLSELISNPLKSNLKRDILTRGTKIAEQTALVDGVQEVVEGFARLKVELQHLVSFNDALYHTAFSRGHAERVSFLSAAIAVNEKVSAKNLELLMLACKYHDLGRISTDSDLAHGQRSVYEMERLGLLNHLPEDERNIVNAIVDSHSSYDKNMENTLNKHDVPLSKYPEVLELCKMLKDAEALDKVRMFKLPSFTASRMINVSLLKTRTSKKLVAMAFELNDYYARFEIQ